MGDLEQRVSVYKVSGGLPLTRILARIVRLMRRTALAPEFQEVTGPNPFVNFRSINRKYESPTKVAIISEGIVIYTIKHDTNNKLRYFSSTMTTAVTLAHFHSAISPARLYFKLKKTTELNKQQLIFTSLDSFYWYVEKFLSYTQIEKRNKFSLSLLNKYTNDQYNSSMRNNVDDKFFAYTRSYFGTSLSKIFSLGNPVKIFPTKLRVMPLATLAAVAATSYFTVPPEAWS